MHTREKKPTLPPIKITLLAPLLALAGVLLAPCSQAEVRLGEKWVLSVQGTLGMVYNDDGDARFYRDMSQRKSDFSQLSYQADTRLGLHLSYRPTPALSAEIQTLTYYGLSNRFQSKLFSALIRWHFAESWKLRAGMIPLETFYNSDSIHAGFSYLWARPATEMYNYNIASGYRGLSLEKRFLNGLNQTQLQAFGGYLGDAVSLDSGEDYDSNHSKIYGGSLKYTLGFTQFSLGYTHFEIDEHTTLKTDNNLFINAPGDATPTREQIDFLVTTLAEDYKIDYAYAGVATGFGRWRIDAAAGTIRSGYLTADGSYNGYISVGYRKQNWTPYIRLSYAHNDGPTRTAIELPEFVAQAILFGARPARANQTNLALGARFDLADQLAVKLQYNYVRNTENPTYLWRNETSDWDGKNQLLSLVMDFTF